MEWEVATARIPAFTITDPAARRLETQAQAVLPMARAQKNIPSHLCELTQHGSKRTDLAQETTDGSKPFGIQMKLSAR